jgi:dTDP-4-dehydrorhamnose 3,5-epimerase
MRSLPTKLNGPLLFAPAVHGDGRGFFLESFRLAELTARGVSVEWVQDNHSRSRAGVIRGMHFQPGQAKLVRCARGAIYDVVVDIRPTSPSFGRWEGFVLDDSEHRQVFCPAGFAHGFCVLSEVADVVYKVSTYYDPSAEGGFRYDDPEVGIQWPDGLELVPSARDSEAPTLAELRLRP